MQSVVCDGAADGSFRAWRLVSPTASKASLCMPCLYIRGLTICLKSCIHAVGLCPASLRRRCLEVCSQLQSTTHCTGHCCLLECLCFWVRSLHHQIMQT